MKRSAMGITAFGALLVALIVTSAASARAGAQEPPPRILLDASPRAIEYQLGRLTNDELMRVERKEDDVRYRPVYLALLTRKGLGREFFDEALTALTRMDKASPSAVLLEALSKVADGDPRKVWDDAVKREGHVIELLRSVPHLGGATELRQQLFDPIAALLAQAQDPPTRAAAIAAIAWTRADTATFRLLAREVLQGPDAEARAAGIRALLRLPRDAGPPSEIDPLARAIVVDLGKTPPDRRTEAASTDAMHLAEKLAEALPDEARRAVRRDLRALGVQVVRIETIPEQMIFDVKWFAVEAGKPVQIVLYNPDAMSHNLLVTKPGSLREVGMAASTMPMSADPAAKPYVPNSPLVLHATRLLNWNETERLGFAAPKEPGEYPFVCTFPGHWVRMYGVMLVVENLEKWETTPTVPTDPMTNQPFASQRNIPQSQN
ncbi:MAG: hypothetical protein LC804_28410 [Acidobacteria bacterium]|nr:hypothetical protein [Acidobacteriota bacterium]